MSDAMPRQRGRRRRRAARGRLVAVLGVIAIGVAVAVIDASNPVPSPAPAPSGATGPAPVPVASSYSSSAFCAGGTAGAGEPATSVVYLDNTTDHAVSGSMSSVLAPGTGPGTSGNSKGDPGPAVVRTVEVPARGSVAIDPATGLGQGFEATSFTFAGGGVAASQVVSGPNGWSTAPCASRTSSSWTFAGGDTSTGNLATLALYNPAATTAVVNISFLTKRGVLTPQSYQGLSVASGRLVTENLGDFVQDQKGFATLVTTQSGSLVANQLQQWSTAPNGGIGLQLGAPALSSTWHFAQTTNSSGSTVTFWIANPGKEPATVTVSPDLSMATASPFRREVPGRSVAALVATKESRIPAEIPYSVHVEASAPVDVVRTVQAASGASPPVWGLGTGVPAAASRWLVTAPGNAQDPGIAGAAVSSLAVANPGTRPSRVEVTVAGTGRSVATFVVKPRSLSVLGAALVNGLDAYQVRASEPVTVEEDSVPTPIPGIVSSPGVPISG